jgi:hypothetical protein
VTLAVPRLVAATKRLLEKGEVTIPGHGSITSKVQFAYIKITYFAKSTGFCVGIVLIPIPIHPPFHFDLFSNFYRSWKIRNLFFTFIHRNASLHCFTFLISVTGVIISSILDSILQFS